MSRLVPLTLIAAIASLSLAVGCAGTVRVTARATIKTPKVVIGTNPGKLPAPPVVVKPAPPAEGATWVPGHYKWNPDPGKYVWVAGHWENPRAGEVWIPGHYEWSRAGKVKVRVWVPGHWEKQDGVAAKPPGSPAQPAAEPAATGGDQAGGSGSGSVRPPAEPLPAHGETADLPEGPPEARKPAEPDGPHFWIEGHWLWNADAGKYDWQGGRWEASQRDQRWVAGHYKQARVKSVMVQLWEEGYWEPVHKGAEKPPTAKHTIRPVPDRPAARRPPRPARAMFWIDGYYSWDRAAADYQWTDGRWARLRHGMAWVSGRARWVRDGDQLVQVYVQGYWTREGDDAE